MYLVEYIQHLGVAEQEAGIIAKRIKEKVDFLVQEEFEELKKISNVALNFSNYFELLNFFSNLSEENIERFKSIDWDSFKMVNGKWNTCSGEAPWIIKDRMLHLAEKMDYDRFIGELNSLLGNCCINSIHQLDDI